MSNSLELIRRKLREAQERKKILEIIKLENDIDISGDRCYNILIGQISALKALLKEIDNEKKKFGGFSQ